MKLQEVDKLRNIKYRNFKFKDYLKIKLNKNKKDLVNFNKNLLFKRMNQMILEMKSQMKIRKY